MAKERRTFFRFSTHCPVKVESAMHGVSYCIAKNISEEGIFLQTDEPLPIGTIVEIWFTAQNGSTPIIGKGEVKHHFYFHFAGDLGAKALTGMGVRFKAFDALEEEPMPEWAFGVTPPPLH